MKLFTAIATASVLGASTIASPLMASASTSYCYQTESNNTVCILSVKRTGTNTKLVRSNINGGSVNTTKVYCNPSHRYNFKQNMYGIACFQFS